MKILVTGGAGYIGSHTALELLSAGHEPVLYDNFCNSKPSVLGRLAQIAGRELCMEQGDIRDRARMREVFARHQFDAVIHFAGLKAVGESVEKPLEYYDNNINGSLILFECMAEAGVKQLVFSSSATVYGDPHTVPITEDFPVSATNPYGRSKLMIEQILHDVIKAKPDWHIALLRYFNPVGAHISGLIGEDPNGPPNNLLPFVAQVAEGRRERLAVFGNDYPTLDGTGMRDYIHVVDLALGHVKTLEKLPSLPGIHTWNLGTGRAYSVLEMVAAFEKACGRPIPYQIVARRPGDIATCYADASLALRDLGWRAERDIEDMCRDAWNWQNTTARHLS
ncbi:UDP-glucose 4-epimerase GalE [Massilia sp. W12]|uniref:UDP-glucose 4-epimerase GalE n=1 Tax=Massilia sp. W12 TaxID=3126507 RepID=UPI0030CADD4C